MADQPSPSATDEPQSAVPLPEFIVKIVWIAVQVSAAFVLSDKATPFFYQQF